MTGVPSELLRHAWAFPTSMRLAMHEDREHVISVVLNHEEWKEFVKRQPQPVHWLRERIQETIATSRHEDANLETAQAV
jgi:hypothetical protein